MNSWIALYQKQELALNEQVEAGRKFLEEVLLNLYAPIVGYGVQEGKLSGLYHDHWVGPLFALTVQPLRPVSSLTVHGWAPDDTRTGGQLTFRAGDQIATKELAPGQFSLSIEIAESTEATISITIEGTRWIMPEGLKGRKLVFVLQKLELGHVN